MIEKIGVKIKRLRTEKKLTQDYVSGSANNSLVSQIENGKNLNPDEITLKRIAEKMEINFEELIKDTDWDGKKDISSQDQIVFSKTDCEVFIDEKGKIDYQMKSFPFKNQFGQENKFDENTGYPLLTECEKCKRGFESINQKFCQGCGEKLFMSENDDFLFFETKIKPLGRYESSAREGARYMGETEYGDKLTSDTPDYSESMGFVNEKVIYREYNPSLITNGDEILENAKQTYSDLLQFPFYIDRNPEWYQGFDKKPTLTNLIEKLSLYSNIHINMDQIIHFFIQTDNGGNDYDDGVHDYIIFKYGKGESSQTIMEGKYTDLFEKERDGDYISYKDEPVVDIRDMYHINDFNFREESNKRFILDSDERKPYDLGVNFLRKWYELYNFKLSYYRGVILLIQEKIYNKNENN